MSSRDGAQSEAGGPGVVETLPELARLAAGASARTATWGVGVSLRVYGRLVRVVIEPQSGLELIQEARAGVRHYVREFLGVVELDEQLQQLLLGSPMAGVRSKSGADDDPERLLRAQGAELLRRSADLDFDDRAHPAYARILEELAPDEARILRLLASEGPQPTVDVRSANLIGVGSQLVARSLNMVGPQAGLRRTDHVPTYLNNLDRLGLIWFSDEALEDPSSYQVLEAQPDVLEAIKSATRAKSIHRSIQLTPFGRDFCDVCLPLEAAEIRALTEGAGR